MEKDEKIKDWSLLPASDVLVALGSDAEKGLATSEAQRRANEWGKNILPREPALNALQLFLRQFKSLLVIILIVAALLSFGVGERVDAVVILVAVLLNVVVGFVQEQKAETALAALQSAVTFQAKVFRDGKESVIDASGLVPGDIVLLEAGDQVPADGRLISILRLELNEAPLTGESAPVNKTTAPLTKAAPLADRTNMAFFGCLSTQGRASFVVTAIGEHTELGKIAKLLKQTQREPTPLQEKFSRLSRVLSGIILGVVALVLVIGLLYRLPFEQMFTVAVALAVGALPEGLVVALTVVLAVGAQRILKRHGLVRKLVAAETLGSTTVICTDKTGTLTQGRMEVTDIVTMDHHFSHNEPQTLSPAANEEIQFAIKLGVLCNNAILQNPEATLKEWVFVGNFTERALLSLGRRMGYDRATLESETPRLDEIPFDSERKLMMTLHRFSESEHIIYAKGAPERLLNLCTSVKAKGEHQRLSAEGHLDLLRKVQQLSETGLRVLAVAYQKVSATFNTFDQCPDPELTFLGFFGIKDPLRSTAIATIQECRQAGMRPVMITGDHRLTARAIAKELNLPYREENILDGEQLDQLSDRQLRERVAAISVYARATPSHKLRIIDAWQARGDVVAMTGDGVNDAPALKSADIGVALGSGTDVAKEVADLVILDDDFSTIVAAVRQGRVLYENIKKVTVYLLSDSFAEITLVLGSILAGIPLPLTPVQILWINIVTDGLTGLALTVEPEDPGVMSERPIAKHSSIVDRPMKSLIAIVSGFSGLINLFLFWWLWSETGSVLLAQTVTFASLGMSSLFYVFSIRSLRRPLWQMPIGSNPMLLVGVACGIGTLLLGIYLPAFHRLLDTRSLGGMEWVLVGAVTVVIMVLIEGFKAMLIRRHSAR